MNSTEIDETLQKVFPLIAAPKVAELSESSAGMRFIAAADGLYREISLAWIRVIHRIATADIGLPYGTMDTRVHLSCSKVPGELWKAFRRDAVNAMPNEMAAALIWNANNDEWRYAMRQATAVAHDAVHYRGEVELQDGEQVVVDLHSHAKYPAFFSKEDDSDDCGTMRFSGVLGNVATDRPSFELRLNMPGICWKANLTQDGMMEVVL